MIADERYLLIFPLKLTSLIFFAAQRRSAVIYFLFIGQVGSLIIHVAQSNTVIKHGNGLYIVRPCQQQLSFCFYTGVN